MLPLDQGQFIPLTQGKFALVDDEDFGEISQYKWRVYEGYSTFYAVRSASVYEEGPRVIWMHRQIMNPPPEMVVDHIDGAGLDNRRENLRVVTQRENSRNTYKRRQFVYDNKDKYGSEERAEQIYDGVDVHTVEHKRLTSCPSMYIKKKSNP